MRQFYDENTDRIIDMKELIKRILSAMAAGMIEAHRNQFTF